MTAADQISAVWFTVPVSVERLAGNGPYGPVHDAPVQLFGRVTEKRKLVRATDGTEVVSEARVSFPADTARIPVGSYVTPQGVFDGSTSEVLAQQLHHDGAGRTPNFYSVDL